MQTLRLFGLAVLVWCRPYDEYVPVTSATYSSPAHAEAILEYDASGELPSTAERQGAASPPPAVMLPFFPFFLFPIPPLDIGPPREQGPLSPAYGPGGGSR